MWNINFFIIGSESCKETEKKEEMVSHICSDPEAESGVKSDQNLKLEESNSDESGYHGEDAV